ncbi:unnamed protein product [Rhizoctonia solani]|uniref:Uncharacterized protein n=1 Tax=Rhizoctonia solani TaxID=456999 RepID=A0A8H2WBY0_9AGAM|nr:unnamed protein product [Rhizoctonia solani]
MGLGSIVPCLIFLGFFLLLLASLSTPIIKTISLLSIKGGKFWATLIGPIISGDVEFGVWGYCVSKANALFLGFNVWETKHCTRIGLGYDIDNRLLDFVGARYKASTVANAKVEISSGNVPWMMCGATIVLWAATIGAHYDTSFSVEAKKGPSQPQKK